MVTSGGAGRGNIGVGESEGGGVIKEVMGLERQCFMWLLREAQRLWKVFSRGLT